MTARNYDSILTVANAINFVNSNTVIGANTGTIATIANVNNVSNTLKVKLSNTTQEFEIGELLYSNNITTSNSANSLETSPYNPSFFTGTTSTANTTISSIAPSTFIAEKNAFEQRPVVRLYTLYYPGEWHPSNSNSNPTGDGAGHAWPVGFPYRFAEIRGDFISDIQYKVQFDSLNYTPYPIDGSAVQLDSSGKINDIDFSISNFDNLITQLVENPFLVGNNTANATIATVNGELVSNIDPRTVLGHTSYDASIVASRGGSNLAFDYDSTTNVNGTWVAGKIDTRDLLGGVIEIKSTFANFLDVWPEYSTVKSTMGNTIEVISSLPYRIGDNVKANTIATEATITNIVGDFIILEQTEYAAPLGDKLFIVNSEADPDNYVIETFKINELNSLDDKVAQFSLTSWLQYFKLQLPKRKFFKNVCPWGYKGTECQYPNDGTGAIPGSNKTANGFFTINNATASLSKNDVCAKNLQACALRKNEIHYGGFAGVGRTIPR